MSATEDRRVDCSRQISWKRGALSWPWTMGKVPCALPPAAALLAGSQGDSSVLKLKAKLNQERKPHMAQRPSSLAGGGGGWVVTRAQDMRPTCPSVSRLSGGVVESESPIPSSRVRLSLALTTQPLQ